MTPPASATPYTIGSITSRDGTTIGYRQFGEGPGIIAIHGGMQAAQNFTKLAEALSDAFTVYVPDRRGRGPSGPPGDHYSIRSECEDIEVLLALTRSHNVFGLSSGALIALQAALTLPAIRKVAVYEPPLSVNHSTPIDWLARYDGEIAQGRLGSAMVTAIRGTETAPAVLRWTPRFLLDPLLDAATRIAAAKPGASSEVPPTRHRRALYALLWPVRRASGRNDRDGVGVARADDVPLRALVPTMHYDVQLVIETEGALETFRAIPGDVLLMGGSRSPAYLKASLRALGNVLPAARHVEFRGLDHVAADNTGNPQRVAEELRRFFSAPTARK